MAKKVFNPIIISNSKLLVDILQIKISLLIVRYLSNDSSISYHSGIHILESSAKMTSLL